MQSGSLTTDRAGRREAMVLVLLALFAAPTASPAARAQEPAGESKSLADSLRELETECLEQPAPGMLRETLRAEITEANERSTREWRKIASRSEWQTFREQKLERLRKSLGDYPEPPAEIATRVTSTIGGPGFRIENLLFESRPGLWVTANRYVPVPARPSMPGILLCHAHHTPKEHSELQHMGMTWARRGAVVLVMDQLGHGERRQHPFRSAEDYPASFQVSRQDYYFRYDNGIEAHLAGESLIGQFAWDLMRGVDLLLHHPGVDAERIALLGAVAGGGDPASVAAALDERIAVAVPFNFGGPQPETRYPLPEDADARFNYAGSGSWESTRNLRGSAADGFLPWVIVGGIAPRKHIYAHEFAWDRQRDPVWRRLRHIHGWFGEPEDSLDWVHGFGAVTLRPPNASHCTHIGPLHRERIHAAFERWFGMKGGEQPEYKQHLPAEDLRCWTDEHRAELQPLLLHQVLARRVDDRLATRRAELAAQPFEKRRSRLAADLRNVLGSVTAPAVQLRGQTEAAVLPQGVTAHRVVLETDPGILVPVLLLQPESSAEQPVPVVVVVAQSGKQALLEARGAPFAKLLQAGVAICLPDLRGTGETRPDAGRSRRSSATSLSSTALMVGDTLLAARLRDLRGVLAYVRGRDSLDPARVALWGDSLSQPNSPEQRFDVPRGIDGRPRQSEPLGGTLALLGALYEPSIRAVYTRHGLVSFRSVLDSPLVYIPHDVVIPGLLRRADLADVAAALAPRPLRIDQPVDGGNRPVDGERLEREFAVARQAYRETNTDKAEHPLLALHATSTSQDAPADWLIHALRETPR